MAGSGQHDGILAGWLVGRGPTQVHERLSEVLTSGLASVPVNHQRVLTSVTRVHIQEVRGLVTLRAPGVPGLKQAPSQQGKEMQAENSAFGEGPNKVFRIQGAGWDSGPDRSQQE